MSTSSFVKRAINRIKNSLDEKTFLTSEGYRNFLEKTARGVTGDYLLKVRFGETVCTDGKIIWVNPLSPNIQKLKELSQKTLCILGQIAHETFHVLYTDWTVVKQFERLQRRIGYFRTKVLHEILNIIEDAAIELAGTNYYTGTFRQAIIALNKNSLENMPSLEELSSKNAPRLAVFLQACAMYCILGVIKGKILDPEVLSLFQKAMPVLEEGRLAPNTSGRFEAAKKVYEIAEPLIKEVEQQNREQKIQEYYIYTKNAEISGDENSQPQPSPPIQYDFQAERREATKKEIEQQIRKNNSSNSQKNEQQLCNEKKEDKGVKEDKSETHEKNELKERKEEGTQEQGDKRKESRENSKNFSNVQNTQSDKTNETQNESQEDLNKETDEDKNKEETTYTDNNESNEEKEEKEILKDLEKQLDKVKEEAAEEYYSQEQLKQREKEIQEFAKTITYSNLHKRIQTKTNTVFNITEFDREKYYKEYEKIASLTRNLSKSLTDLIRFNEDVKLSGLYTGKVDRGKIYRLDKRIFYQRKEKSDEADLAIVLLVDQSGSMDGRRIMYARLACMMLYEVCAALKIPLAIIGHWAKHGANYIYHNHFVDFDFPPSSKYNLSLLDAYENTREGVSLKYAGEYLLTRPEADKILISISDGEPCHYSGYDMYDGELAQNDAARVVRQLEAQGIKVFGVAIGEGRNGIKKIYTKNYIDIPSINLLPVRLVGLIRKNLFK